MKKQITYSIPIMAYIIMVVLILIPFFVNGQVTEVTIGNGTTFDGYAPFARTYNYGWSKSLYLKSEINSVGDITAIAYENNVILPSATSWAAQKIYMRHTSSASETTSRPTAVELSSDWSLVYDGSINYDSVYKYINLMTTFYYNNTDNLEIYYLNYDASYNNNGPQFRYTTSANRTVYYRHNTKATFDANTAGTLLTQSPNIKLKLLLSPPAISGLSASSGCVGSTLVIDGSHLGGATSVSIGGTAATITANTATTIMVTVGNGTTGTVTVTTPGGTDVSSATYTINPLPPSPGVINSNSPQCAGIGITFNRGSCTAGTCYWVSSATGTETANSSAAYTTATTAGTYNVWIRSFDGSCWSQAVTASGTVTALPSAPIPGPITQPTCSVTTGSVILNGLPASGNWTITRTPGGNIYNGSGSSIEITGLAAETTYTFVLTDASGCTSLVSANVVISASAVPPTPVIVQNGNLLHSSSATGNQWYNQANGLIGGATSQDYTITANGYYYVIVTIGGCSSDTSNIIHVTNAGIEMAGLAEKITVYPNPATDRLFVNFGKINDIPKSMKMFNVMGQIVFETEKPLQVNQNGIDISHLGRGNYSLQIVFEKGPLNKACIIK